MIGFHAEGPVGRCHGASAGGFPPHSFDGLVDEVVHVCGWVGDLAGYKEDDAGSLRGGPAD